MSVYKIYVECTLDVRLVEAERADIQTAIEQIEKH
jgi:hypothetical protein